MESQAKRDRPPCRNILVCLKKMTESFDPVLVYLLFPLESLNHHIALNSTDFQIQCFKYMGPKTR